MSEATRAENVTPKSYDLEAHYQELEQKITAAGIPADLGRVRAAFECADRAHSGQKRRDGSPYVSHCIAAAIITAEMGLDEDSIIAALLHDTIEDTSLTHDDIARSFGTSVADIVEGVVRVMQHAPEKQNGEDGLPIPPYKVYNIGNSHPENLLEFVDILQQELLRAGVLPSDYDFDAHKELVPMQPGDVPVTYADTTPLEQDFGFKPSTPLREGLRKFAEWYRGYYAK